MNTTDTSVTGSYMPPPPIPPQRPRRRHPVLFALSMISLIVVAGIVGIAVAAGSHPAVHRDTLPGSGTVTFSPEAVQPVNPITAAPVGTFSEREALQSAKDYLSYSAFSKKGLIHQLDSKYGEGFPKADAVWAVNHVHVSWFKEAVLSAKDYLQTGSFSRSGLIDQLSSPYGEQFTVAQATYAADKVGL